MRRLTALLAIAALITTPATAQESPAPGEDSSWLLLRAVRDDLDPGLVRWIADNAEPRRLTPEAFPTLSRSTGDEVAAALCGTVGSTYWSMVGTLNAISDKALAELRTNPLGARAHRLLWPACLFVERGNFEHRLLPGESVPLIYKRQTGSGGQQKTWWRFFRRSDPGVLTDPDPGETLRFSFRTLPTAIVPKGDALQFTSQLSQIAAAAAGVADDVFRTLPEPTSGATDTGGEIILPLDWGTVAAASSADCEGAPAQAFDASAVVAAFGNSGITVPDDIDLVVADNGFNGGVRQGNAVKFNPLFERRYFRVWPQGSREIIGPVITHGPENRFEPLNSENGLSAAQRGDPASGHGTHVLALALGGPARGLPEIFGTGGDAWLQASVIALAPGTRSVPVYSLGQLNEALVQIRLYQADIINMSVRFGLAGKGPLESLIRARPDTLFVVAAGNDWRNLDASGTRIYPAQLGTDRRVITVAAEDGTGTLTAFSNRGTVSVTLAAPGCNIRSTLDGIAEADLSGTSQAAPLVSFAAALLLRRGMPIEDVKRRLALSGDLLDAYRERRDGNVVQIAATADARVPILTRSRLNIAKALYFSHDYLKYRDPNGTEVTVLGELESATGPGCDVPDGTFSDVFALKRSRVDESLWCFWRGELAPRRIAPAVGHTLNFNVQLAIGPGGTITPEQRTISALPLEQVRELLRSNEHMELRDPE